MIQKRPLLLVWAGLMLAIWILKAADAPVFGEPQPDSLISRMTESADTLYLEGAIRERRETASGMRYILRDVTVSDSADHSPSADNSNPSKTTILKPSSSGVKLPKIILNTTKDTIYRIGARICCSGELKRIEAASNPGQFDMQAYYACSGIYYSVRTDRIIVIDSGGGLAEAVSLLRNRLTKNVAELMPDETGGVLCGMLLGERLLLEDAVRRDYQIGGIMHVLAISGLHISMLGMSLFMALQYAGLPLAAAAPVSSLFMILYCLMVGNSASAVRALVMYTVMLGARITKRSYDMLSAMSFAGILILLMHPGYLFLSGFQLSFAAILGIALVHPALEKQIGKKVKGAAAMSFMTWSSVTVMTLPLTVWYNYEIPVYSFLINLLVLPFIEPVLMLGAAGCAASLFSRFLAVVLLCPVRLMLTLTDFVLRCMRNVPGAAWICGRPEFWEIVLYYIAAAVTVYLLMRPGISRNRLITPSKSGYRQVLRTAVRCAPLITAMIIMLLVRPNPAFSFTALDVGQGDGLVIRTGNKSVYLADCGSTSVDEVGKWRLIPYLKHEGIRHLDGIFLSHGDEDHVNGIEELLREIADGSVSIKIDALFLPNWMQGTEQADLFEELCRKTGSRAVYLEQGDMLQAGGLQIRVLHPLKKQAADGNEGSMVLRVSYQNFDVLLTGDLEGVGEEELLESIGENSGEELQESIGEDTGEGLLQNRKEDALAGIECLKVAHHGSKNATSSAFLQKVKPKMAVISAGKNNRYGHPHREVLERLDACGSKVFRTDREGAVTVYYDGKRAWVNAFRKRIFR